MTVPASCLLTRHLDHLRLASRAGPILDLACGSGRNGLYLIQHKIPVMFADIDELALKAVENSLSTTDLQQCKSLATLWPVDFEQPSAQPLGDAQFGGIIVFRYLHRALIQDIRRALIPGGILVYETFTVDQPQYGRPKNRDFLLRPGELQGYFSDWDILHQFEGIVEHENNSSLQAIAQIIAFKPECPQLAHGTQRHADKKHHTLAV